MAWKPDYATSAEVKSYLRIADTDDDVQIALYTTAASRAIDDHCGRQFGVVSAAEEREYEPTYDRYIRKYIVPIDDLMTTTGLVVTGSEELTSDSYELWPLNAPSKGMPWTQLRVSTRCRLTVEALWGWTAVPTPIKLATLIQASRFAARRDSPYGVAGSPTEGSEVRLLASLDPDLKTSVRPFVRKWWAA